MPDRPSKPSGCRPRTEVVVVIPKKVTPRIQGMDYAPQFETVTWSNGIRLLAS